MTTEPSSGYPAPMAGREAQRIAKPWGYELWWARTPAYAAKVLVVEKGHALSLQLHHEKDESSFLYSGQLRLVVGPTAEALEERTIEPGESWRVEPGVVHSIEALEPSVIFEVSTPELDDVVRLSDRYGRAGED